jgi:long-chain acyl-CoA synthetase
VRASLLETLNDFERWGSERDTAYVFPRGYRHERWSYRRVTRLVYQFARELQARNIVKGDAVLLWAPNSAEWVAAFLSCAITGVLAVPIDDASTPDFARRVSAQVRTRLVLCPRDRHELFARTASGNPITIPTIAADDLPSAVSRHSPDSFRPCLIQPSDPLEIVFTSGTTAEPKGVVITHANVVGNVRPIEAEMHKYLRYERFVHPLRFLNLLPLSHVFGQFLGIFLPPLFGATVVFENTFHPSEMITTIHRERVSVLVAVPRMIESLKQKIERDLELGSPKSREKSAARFTAAPTQHFLRRWWTFRDIRRRFGWKFLALISGGAALDRETEAFWHRLGYAVIQGYGLTETTSLISLNHPFHTSRGSIGKVLPGREIKLAADGEILVRGSGVAKGYWNGRELASIADPADDGWYRTGDLGALDQSGNLFFKGRKKEVIVTAAGMNIYPEDLEAALRSEKELRDCVVVGLTRGGNAEPCAVLILNAKSAHEENAADFGPAVGAAKLSGADRAARALVERANQKLAEYQRMHTWFVWREEDFPRSSTQKPRRNLIRDAVESALAGQSPSATASPLAELIARITRRPAQSFSPDSNLETGLGLSSLERVELLSALEDRFQIDLSETTFASISTVGDLERLLQSECAGSSADLPAMGVGKSDSRNSPELSPKSARFTPAPRAAFHYPRWTLRWPVTWIRLAAQYLLALPATLLLGWPRVVGCENLDGVLGPLLIVCNHIGDIDVGFIQAALPARFRHKLATATGGEALELLHSPPGTRLPKRTYDRIRWTLAVALLNLFPLPREAGFRKSFAYAGEAVDRGYNIVVFPEGRHTEDGGLRPFRSGIGLLANNLRLPVLPMRIDGLYELKRAGKKFAPPGKITVRIGKPIHFVPDTDPVKIAHLLRQAIGSL